MSERSNTLVQQWLQQSAVTDNELQQLADDKPYFSAAQLLLLNCFPADTEQYATQKKRAALHVYNPIQLEAKTSEAPFNWNAPLNETPVEVESYIEPEPTSIEEKEIETFVSVDEAPTEAEKDFIKVEQEEVATNEAQNLESQKEKETFLNSFENDTEEVLEIESDEEQSNVDLTENKAADENHFEQEPVAEEEITEENEVPTIRMPSFDLNAPVNAAAGAITFEPFHTVDYFASQGIKLSQTEASSDRFGKQVKSFTEWLKTMKKLPTTAITQNTDGAGESKVANLAAHSLQNADVVTESMAEVWVKQGNIQKASEVYNKLSLQNPSKKAYFAAKIESLKKPS